jgi:hypothetical protein
MTGARQFGKLLKANWGKDAWTHLSTDAQWLYAYLVSQPTTDTAGVFQIRISKWSKGSPDMTKERVAAAAKMLVDRGWIAVDHDTEEGLLRNYMRDDWAGKLIFKGALARALLVQSMPLRAVLLSEIRELKCERPIVEDDQLSLIADLEQSVPPDFDTLLRWSVFCDLHRPLLLSLHRRRSKAVRTASKRRPYAVRRRAPSNAAATTDEPSRQDG